MAKWQYPKSDHFDGKVFFNQVPVAPKSLLKVLQWKFQGNQQVWPDTVENEVQASPRSSTSDKEVVATFVNHATYLLQLKATNIIVDPVFSKRVSPFQWLGPKRVRPPGILLEKLPRIDIVLVTHNHYDHLDIDSLIRLEKLFKPIFIAPLGNAKILKDHRLTHVHELDWWQSYQASEVNVTVTPAQHWSGRRLKDRFEALWGGFYLQSKAQKIFWAGDTGYGPHFQEIQKKLGSPNLSFLPIGAYEPRWFMKDMHMNPDDAVKAHKDLQASLSVGMHYGTFQLTDESIDAPIKDLEIAKKKYQVEDFIILKEGETRTLAV